MAFLTNKETNEVFEFNFNTVFFKENEDGAIRSFAEFMHYLLEDLKGFKEQDVRETIEQSEADDMLCTVRVQGKGLFNCNYDKQITINILKENRWFSAGTSFPSHFLINSTPFKAGDKEHNKRQHGKPQANTQYIVSDSLHFITYPDGNQEIMYFD